MRVCVARRVDVVAPIVVGVSSAFRETLES
jgi:hypothetical protein